MAWINDANNTFTNPYNFISLDESCRRDHDYRAIKNGTGLKTGYIDIRLTAQTPIFIPNTTNKDFFGIKDSEDRKVKSYDFFSYRDNQGIGPGAPLPVPIIPGSSIRGMIRSAFEAVTKSCLSTLDKDRTMYKRTVKPGDPGVLKYDPKRDRWRIKPCKKICVEMSSTLYSTAFKSLPERTPVWVMAGSYNNRTRCDNAADIIIPSPSATMPPDYQEGFIHHGELFGTKKHYEYIFIVNPRIRAIPLSEGDIKRLLKNIELYKDESVNIHFAKTPKQHNGYRQLNPGTIYDLSGACIYYRPDRPGGCYYYLSPAAVSREVFHNKLGDAAGDFTPCEDSANLCAACVLFGMVQGRHAVASRLRFTDAKPEQNPFTANDYFESSGPVILAELSSPKPSATEFYLQKPGSNAAIWNYDYAEPSDDFPNYRAKLRGRKFYWNRNIETSSQIPQEPTPNLTERNVAVRPVRKGAPFIGRIYFNDITQEELNMLLWVLRPLGAGSSKYHKIGMGKPLGLGSVSIDINEVKWREIRRNDERQTIEYVWHNDPVAILTDQEAIHLLGCTRNVFNEFIKITDFNNAPDNLGYPMAQNVNGERNVYSWFVGNKQHSATGGRPWNHFINKHLKAITDEDVPLPVYREIP